MKYKIEVYDDCALASGAIPVTVFLEVAELCRKEGFTHVTYRDDGEIGFKFIRKEEK